MATKTPLELICRRAFLRIIAKAKLLSLGVGLLVALLIAVTGYEFSATVDPDTPAWVHLSKWLILGCIMAAPYWLGEMLTPRWRKCKLIARVLCTVAVACYVTLFASMAAGHWERKQLGDQEWLPYLVLGLAFSAMSLTVLALQTRQLWLEAKG